MRQRGSFQQVGRMFLGFLSATVFSLLGSCASSRRRRRRRLLRLPPRGRSAPATPPPPSRTRSPRARPSTRATAPNAMATPVRDRQGAAVVGIKEGALRWTAGRPQDRKSRFVTVADVAGFVVANTARQRRQPDERSSTGRSSPLICTPTGSIFRRRSPRKPRRR